MRVVIHAQHLSGVGHHVRALELARALADVHDVHLVDGGAPVPTVADGRVARIPLPRLRRGATGLEPVDGGAGVDRVLAARRAALVAATTALAPDVVLVEHYPFSKWDLEDELLAMLAAARAARPDGLAVASVRDVPRQTRHEAVAPAAWADRVRARLEAHFDALLVHGDPRVTSLADHFPGAATLRLPVEATGYVVAPAAPEATPPPDLVPAGRPYVVASGGGAGNPALLTACVTAWRQHAGGALAGRTLVVFTGVATTEGARATLRAAAGDAPVVVTPFRPDFARALRHADLSISGAGYNTCAALLAARRRAVLVPDPAMSDQGVRAARFAALHLATVVEAPPHASDRGAEAPADAQERADAFAQAVATAAIRALAAPPPTPDASLDVNLEGARRTREVIETLARQRASRRAAR